MTDFERNNYKELRDKIVHGLEEAYKRLVEFKKQKNSPMVVSRNGRIQIISPPNIPPTTTYQ